MTPDKIKAKAYRVVYSCQTEAHARCADKYLTLLAHQCDMDITPLRGELATLFGYTDNMTSMTSLRAYDAWQYQLNSRRRTP